MLQDLDRITQPTLDVLEALYRASAGGEELHGWAIMKETHRAGPTVYKVLDRLAQRGWVEWRWEELDDDQSSPRKRFYKLTGEAVPAAGALLRERRPEFCRTRPVLGFRSLSWLRGLGDAR
ncbi:PadR family transcriptional regulator [Herbidospora sp. RD11066]